MDDDWICWWMHQQKGMDTSEDTANIRLPTNIASLGAGRELRSEILLAK
jgi:hypothetical protein